MGDLQFRRVFSFKRDNNCLIVGIWRDCTEQFVELPMKVLSICASYRYNLQGNLDLINLYNCFG